MSDYDNAIFRLATAQGAEPEDYIGEDGLLYCGSCRQPKEAYFPEGNTFFGRDRHPKECDCQRKRRETLEASHREYKHREEVERLKRKGFTDPAMREWTFENDNGKCPQMHKAYSYVEQWERVSTGNYGLILWGNVGTGKSYFAGCVANALMEKEVSVCMTNFALILNDLAASYKDRNEYIARLCSFPLLILDDFGMERGTEYGLEQVYNVIDSRYRSGKPLIVTTNLTLEELQNPEDTAHARIYDRLTEMCTPVRITGENFRKARAREKMEQLKNAAEQKGEPMTDTPNRSTATTARRPDCVTEVRRGNTVLVVSGYFKQGTTATAADKMMKVLEAESAAGGTAAHAM